MRRGLLIGLPLLLAPVLGVARPATTAARPGQELLSLSELLPDPTIIHPDIAAGLEVNYSAIGSIAASLSQARADLIEASNRANLAEARLGSLDVARQLHDSKLKQAQSDESMAVAVAARNNEELGQFAVEAFVAGDEQMLEQLTMRGRIDPRDALANAAGVLLKDLVDQAVAQAAAATAATEEHAVVLRGVIDETAQVGAERVRALADAEDAARRVQRFEPAFEEALMTAPVDGFDFPIVVLDAYYRAELKLAEDRPRCAVRWYQLAAIGRVESGHGTAGGSSVGADGLNTGRILGPVLDWSRFSSIPDTDGGLHDGDILWDRGVGPMQFIPSSWKLFGRDGNGDHFADPHNMYDAALAAGEHLCRAHSGLDKPEQYRQALLGYNGSASYGLRVMGYADAYRIAVDLQPESEAFRALVRSNP
ncbi:MAG: lytic transglycosylase domain-containing protein [Actinomycetota bacterium]|nr:lytic transglycosylase domain-containing protein [Actinomycetota bacterium]